MKNNSRSLLLYTTMVLLGLLFVNPLVAQRRSELMAQIDTLEARLLKTKRELAESQAREKASLAKADSYESQVSELKDANATLLKNLGNFAEVSNKNTSALNQALGSLQAKEQELRAMTNTMSSNDSSIIALLTDAKATLGPDAKLKVAGGSLVISGSLEQLFGGDTSAELTEGAASWVEGIAKLLKSHPKLGVTVEGLSMVGDLALASRQGTAVMNALRDQQGIAPGRMVARGRDGNFSEGVDILIHPDYRSFYQGVKAQTKN
ncbi:hypothetical protein [Robiginitalea sp. SC105]|uniref:hypothetical protein n=1 Tax=Robiginitalea sp. SC105 TaxID=2762332 RepID=UPI00163A8FBC|nr:hypothetical protein [Robiginitalea sp. SC105]MBC2840471.1 hypothetical protein [Robiginitalea sp. SC105]